MLNKPSSIFFENELGCTMIIAMLYSYKRNTGFCNIFEAFIHGIHTFLERENVRKLDTLHFLTYITNNVFLY